VCCGGSARGCICLLSEFSFFFFFMSIGLLTRNSNLLKRIREMSEATTPLFPSEALGAGALPQPVQRPV
jgi:hypothetical protein